MSALVILFFIGLNLGKAQTKTPDLLVVINKADWCHVCKANGNRIEKDIAPKVLENENSALLVNDLSDKMTQMTSMENLASNHLTDFLKENKATGIIYFVNNHNQKVISEISVTKPNKEILMAYNVALKMAHMPMHGEKGHVCNESCMTK